MKESHPDKFHEAGLKEAEENSKKLLRPTIFS
jgi:hypothetical protein